MVQAHKTGLVLSVTLTAAPENFPRLKELIAANASAAVATEPGCRQFDIFERADTPNHLYFYEVYDDEAALEAHRRSAHYATFFEASKSIVTSRSVEQGSMVLSNRK